MGRPILDVLTNLQGHRGPDNTQIWEQEIVSNITVGLGHNRLSVLDLSDKANQPFVDSTESIIISYNGEIFNYLELRSELIELGVTFRTQSDTEVIVEAYRIWRDSAWSRMNGMFALVILDLNLKHLTLVRSRWGSKPICFANYQNTWFFASEDDALAEATYSRVKVEDIRLGANSWNYGEGESRTIFSGINRVKPGHFLRFSITEPSTTPSLHKWYSVSDSIKESVKVSNKKDESNIFFQKLMKSVEIRLRSDVPVGISLSGGLDSSSIMECSKELGTPLVKFMFDFPGNPETQWIHSNKKLRDDIVIIGVPKRNEMRQTILETFKAQGSPPTSTSVLAQHRVFSEVSRNGIKVCMGGQGADEVLLGYRKSLLRAIIAYSTRNPIYSFLNLTGLIGSLSKDYDQLRTLKASFFRERREESIDYEQEMHSTQETLDKLLLTSLVDLHHSSLPTLLRFEDRNSMYSGVESRLPFLDYQLVEYVLQLPKDLKVNRGYGKYILRLAMDNRLPHEVVWSRQKRGFEAKTSLWCENGLLQEMKVMIIKQNSLLREAGFLEEEIAKCISVSEANFIQNRRLESNVLAMAWFSTWLAEENRVTSQLSTM